MTRYSIIAITTVCVVLSACASATVQPDADGRVHGTVVSVADGDTVTVKFASGQEKIRLIGVDTPETVHPTRTTIWMLGQLVWREQAASACGHT